MNSKWSSLDFPLLGADVQNCKKETGEKKGGGGSYSYTMIHKNKSKFRKSHLTDKILNEAA